MNLLQVLILGAIEGFTEFLPISSTAHLLIASRLLQIPETEFLKTFIIAIQLGAILAVVALYAKTFIKDWQVNLRVAAAFLPTAFFGFILYHFIKSFLFENMAVIIAALFLGGVGLVFFERWYRPERATERGLANIPYWKVFVVGCAQALAVVPGVSRAGATIIAGMLLGIERSAIVEFSFLLAVPTMAAATGYDLLKTGAALNAGEFHLIALGFMASFVFAIIGVKFFINLIKTRSFTSFGVYRILLALFLLGSIAI